MKRVSVEDFNRHCGVGKTTFMPNSTQTNSAAVPVSTPRVKDARIYLWDALKKIGQAKHELRGQSPVVESWLAGTDESIRAALKLIL